MPDLTPYLNKIICGDCLEVMRGMPDGCIQCCVTSPPYWGLRDYGTATWEGGDDGCDHLAPFLGGFSSSGLAQENNGLNDDSIKAKIEQRQQQYKNVCRKCGARRIDQQLGLESTPEEFVAKMVDVFREVHRVLKDDGTCWINMGDSYTSGNRTHHRDPDSKNIPALQTFDRIETPPGLKPKDLVGVPWRVAFSLQSDGWYLRQDIIWHKPNPMPESVRDRCTKAHEYLFLLSKSAKYYWDQDAIREPFADSRNGCSGARIGVPESYAKQTKGRGDQGLAKFKGNPKEGRNLRSVWTIPTQPFPEAHFATFPPKLIEPCILAGSRTNDVVLDPFMGAGTTAVVAGKLDRQWVGIELSSDYVCMAEKRIEREQQQLNMFHTRTVP